MRVSDELNRLQAKLDVGEMSLDEPIFVLRARDSTAAATVQLWIGGVALLGTPESKIDEANETANLMRDWPEKQIPGVPESRGPSESFGPTGVPKHGV